MILLLIKFILWILITSYILGVVMSLLWIGLAHTKKGIWKHLFDMEDIILILISFVPIINIFLTKNLWEEWPIKKK